LSNKTAKELMEFMYASLPSSFGVSWVLAILLMAYAWALPRRHDFNEYNMLLKHHLDDRDSMLTKINHAGQRKQLLQSTNVYNDAFKIW